MKENQWALGVYVGIGMAMIILGVISYSVIHAITRPAPETIKVSIEGKKWACHLGECLPIVGTNRITSPEGIESVNYIIRQKDGTEFEASEHLPFYTYLTFNRATSTKEYYK